MIVSIIHDPSIKYPSGGDYFSPDHAWPEYRLGHLSGKPNPVYAAVRTCLAEAGLDKNNFGQPGWNPLGEYISPGNRVFLLCNFVKEKEGFGSDDGFLAKCTHASVIRAVIDYVLLALNDKGSIAFGNAPLQSCDWSAVIQQTGAAQVQEFYSKYCNGAVKVNLVDLRQHIIRRSPLGDVTTDFHADSGDHCVEVDLNTDSLLDRLYSSTQQPRFRVLDYDPRRTEGCHQRGHHRYILNRRIIESDVVISIPKLKTHEKVGITCGIKGCVGAVAHKDCLAHHRYGPPKRGGDEYSDGLSALAVFSALHDRVYSSNAGAGRSIMHSVNYFSRKVIRRFTRALSGSWPGNDTCWRMAVDLARIIKYTDKQGALHPDPQRTHLLITDGIIGGEGDGPLSPLPVPLGYLSFCDDIVAGDYGNALAMGFDPQLLPIIRESFGLAKYPLTDANPSLAEIRINGRTAPINALRNGLGKKFLPPREWRQML